MKYLITHSLNKNEMLTYERSGLFCYELRDSDFGNDIASIEKKVIVNNVGSIIMDEEIDMGKNDFVDYNEFCSNNEQVSKIKDLIPKGNPQKAFENAIKKGMKDSENWKYLYTEKNRDYFKNISTKEYISYSNKNVKDKGRER